MRKLIFPVLIWLLFTACIRREAEQSIPVIDSPKLKIDRPAIVVLQQKSAKKKLAGFGHLKKLSSKFRMPLIESRGEMIEYLKLDGDLKRFDPAIIATRFDFIILDRKHDAIPGTFATAEQIFDSLYPRKRPSIKLIERAMSLQPMQHATDSLQSLLPLRENVGICNPKPAKLVVAVADTTTILRLPLAKAPAEWIFQTVSTRSSLKIVFDNDVLTLKNTDRYYTNGIRLEFQSAALANLHLTALMPIYRRAAELTTSLGIRQEMYTPVDTRIQPSLNHDRPYASVLYATYSRTLVDNFNRLKFTTSLDFGYLGPYSQGENLQKAIHRIFPTNDSPLGWETQIATDIILNYSVQLEKPVIRSNHLQFYGTTLAKVGTLYDMAGVGISMFAGLLKPESPGSYLVKSETGKPKLYVFADASVNAVAYNALLQGGMINRSNVLTLKASEISRATATASTGMVFGYNDYRLVLSQHLLSPEFKGGLWHKWGRVGLEIKL